MARCESAHKRSRKKGTGDHFEAICLISMDLKRCIPEESQRSGFQLNFALDFRS